MGHRFLYNGLTVYQCIFIMWFILDSRHRGRWRSGETLRALSGQVYSPRRLNPGANTDRQLNSYLATGYHTLAVLRSVVYRSICLSISHPVTTPHRVLSCMSPNKEHPRHYVSSTETLFTRYIG